jgi:glycine amidinotransferase
MLKRCSNAVHSSTITRFAFSSNAGGVDVSKHDKPIQKDCPVNAWNEWDPLEEVIVGRPEGSTLPKLTIDVRAYKYGTAHYDLMKEQAGKPYTEEIVKKAVVEMDEFCNILKQEGVTVRRPDPMDWSKEYATPHFTSTGYNCAFPRDIWLVAGNEIIEAPLSWYSRFFEYTAYRSLTTEYVKKGATVVAAPKPQMDSNFYDQDYPVSNIEERKKLAAENKFVISESEISFEAADFMRAGKDIFVRQSHVTNDLGIQWVRQYLAPKGIRVHKLTFEHHNPMHIDCTLYPIKPGLVLSNIKRPCNEISKFKKSGWKVVHPPPLTSDRLFSDDFLGMNVLMLDENRVIIDKDEVPTIRMFEDLGITSIPVNLTHASFLGGGCHCYTTDIRRRGNLESYIDF